MATQLDEKIEQLQNIVEKRLEFYQVTNRFSLPAIDQTAEAHRSAIDSLLPARAVTVHEQQFND